MKLRKLMFVLPNLFTVTSIFCGFWALTLCAGEPSPFHLYQAALSIFFAMFFDGFDGRVARLTKTQTQFGVELDSLADVISFGVAPAMLVYKWALAPLGLLGTVVAFSFAACGALRLARFNVIAHRSHHGGASRFFVGLPIPLAAGMIVSMVIADYVVRRGEVGPSAQVPIAVVVSVLALLMVSTVRYRTFKDVRLNRISVTVFLAITAVGVLIATRIHPAFVLVVYFTGYLLLGMLESAFSLRHRLAARKVAGAAALLEDDDVEDEDEDEEEDDALDGEDFL